MHQITPSILFLISSISLIIAVSSLSAENANQVIGPMPAASSRSVHSVAEESELSRDFTRPSGTYHYLPQAGIYRDVTFGDVAEDFAEAMNSVGASILSINQYANWASRNTLGDLSWQVGGGVGGLTPLGLGFGYGEPYVGTDPNFFSFKAGPIVLDNFYLGYGAIYNDINGAFPGRESFAEDDRFGQIVWLSVRASFVLGNSIGISLQPMIYWLPNTGRVGWGIPGPFAGAMMPIPGAGALAKVTWAKTIGRWQLAAYDQFQPLASQYNIWDNVLNVGGFWGDLSPIDRVGRYGLGVGGNDSVSYDPRVRLGTNAGDWNGMSGYYNIAGLRAFGQHGATFKSMLYFDRIDTWNHNFKNQVIALNGGARIRAGDEQLTPYAGYDFATAEPFTSFIHSALAGVTARIGPSILAYTQAGHYWVTGVGQGHSGWMGLAGFRQQIGANTNHWAEAGRRVFNPGNSAPGIEDFAEYRLSHQLGPRTNALALAGLSQRRLDFVNENDIVLKYAGFQISRLMSNRLTGFASVGWEDIELESDQRTFERWTYRLGINHLLTQTLQLNCFYQYEDTHGTIDFTEHFLYLGAAKKF